MSIRKCALVKISGDITDKEDLYKELSFINEQYDLFVMCGAGTAITAKLRENKIPFKFEGGERVIKLEKGRELAYDVLEEKRAFVEGELLKWEVMATVCSPVMKFGKKICHINGDSFVRMTHRNFDKVFIFTLKGRDKSSLEDIKNIEIVYL